MDKGASDTGVVRLAEDHGLRCNRGAENNRALRDRHWCSQGSIQEQHAGAEALVCLRSVVIGVSGRYPSPAEQLKAKLERYNKPPKS